MARVQILFVLVCLVVVVYTRNSTHRPCHAFSRACDWTHEICCNGTCQKNCLEKRCRRHYECGRPHKCCGRKCRPTCEGQRCYSNRDCVGLQCCNNVCKKHCLGEVCNLSRPKCGFLKRRRLECCGGECRTSCEGRTCETNTDCGGYGYRRTSCCNWECKRSCKGSPCFELDDCRDAGRRQHLACCGFFDEKTCQYTCRGKNCSIDVECYDGKYRRHPLRCCGNEKCSVSCEGSICSTETYRTDCKGPENLYCCGIGQKRCRHGCQNVPCKTTEDCGKSNYYCRLSKCTTTTSPNRNVYIPT